MLNTFKMVPHTAPILKSLTPELSQKLQERNEAILFDLVTTNSETTYFREAPLLEELRRALATGRQEPSDPVDKWGELSLVKIFSRSVPLSNYSDYHPFISRFTQTPCYESSVTDLLAPGLPEFIATSSGTSGTAKYFPKYTLTGPHRDLMVQPARSPKPMRNGGTTCAIVSLRHSRILDIIQEEGDGDVIKKRITFSLVSSGACRMQMGWDTQNDQKLMAAWRKYPTNGIFGFTQLCFSY